MPIDLTGVRYKVRTKTSGLVNNYTELYNQELVFGDSEKSLFIRDVTGNELYQFSPMDDDSTTYNNTWSSLYITEYIDDFVTEYVTTQLINYSLTSHTHNNYALTEHTHNYYSDITNKPYKVILFPSSGGALPPTNYPTPPQVDGENNTRWYSTFVSGNYLSYNLFIPPNFRHMRRFTIAYSCDNTDGIAQTFWKITTKVYDEGTQLDTTSITTYNSSTFSHVPGEINAMKYAVVTPSSYPGNPFAEVFGTGNGGKYAIVEIKLVLAPLTGSYKFYQAFMEYDETG